MQLDFISIGIPYSIPYRIPDMTDVSFKARISKQGDKLVIIIPKALHEMTSSIKGEELLIELKKIEKIVVRKKKLKKR